MLERSLFLNTLIERKAISWTKIFADLEKVLPYNVRLVSVRLAGSGFRERGPAGYGGGRQRSAAGTRTIAASWKPPRSSDRRKCPTRCRLLKPIRISDIT